MNAAATALFAVSGLGLFVVLLVLAVAGYSPVRALGWIWHQVAHPVETVRAIRRGDPL